MKGFASYNGKVYDFHASSIAGGGDGQCHNVKNDRKPVKLQKENPTECVGEGKQSKGGRVRFGAADSAT